MVEKHHSEGKNVRRTLHTMRKRQYIPVYCSQQACGCKRREKSDIAEMVSSKTVNTRSLSLLQPRALSLQNLVSGYKCESLSGRCRTGLTLKRCSQLAAFAIRPVV